MSPISKLPAPKGKAARDDDDDDDELDRELAAEDKLENEAATEIATQFERVLDGMRIYPPGHQTLKGYYQALQEKLQIQLKKDEEYALKVTPMGFATRTKLINKAEKLTDSITHPLFLDGVQMFTITAGVTAEEISRLMEIWRATLDGRLGNTHTFSTRFWEATFEHLEVLSVESFSERGVQGDARAPKSNLQAVIDELSGVSAPSHLAPIAGTAGFSPGRKLARVTKEDLAVLKAQGIESLTEDDLKRHDAAQKAPIPGLNLQEGPKLVAELRARTAQQIERALDAVFVAGTNGTAPEQERLRAAFTVVLWALLEAGQIERLKDNLMRQIAHARTGDPQTLESRFAMLQRLMSALGAPEILERTIAALDDDKKRDTALALLKFLPDKSAAPLLDWLVLPETAAGRQALIDLAATLTLDGNDLTARLGWSDEELALVLLKLGGKLGPGSWPLRKTALTHPSPKVQTGALEGLDKETIAAHRVELLPLLYSPVQALRTGLFSTLVASRDKAVAGALATLLRRVPLDPQEHRKVLIALGTLGGPEACGALRNELQNGKDETLQCTAAVALGNAGDEKARPLLETHANKLFGGGQLKAAAKDALRRLDHLKANAPR